MSINWDVNVDYKVLCGLRGWLNVATVGDINVSEDSVNKGNGFNGTFARVGHVSSSYYRTTTGDGLFG